METGEILLGISIALIAGLISIRLIKLVNLPNVTLPSPILLAGYEPPIVHALPFQ
jgi:hypothetical protein